MDRNDLSPNAVEEIGQLATALRASQRFPLAAAAGERLAQRWGDPTISLASISSGAGEADAIDDLLAETADRFQTPIPEAYLGEWLALQQKKRRRLGAYYTPWPLARYLMRSAAEIAQQEFPGAATTWLDPACGAGVFFAAEDTAAAHPVAARIAWDASPVAIALAQAIRDARGGATVQFQCLDPLQQAPPSLASAPLVVVGNPPYSNFGRRSISPWLAAELASFRPPHGERKTHLRDACILFLRLAQSLIERADGGLIAMVLSTTFLDALTHAHLRAALAASFDELRVLRLDEADALPADNLFAIRQTTAACLFLRRPGTAPRSASIYESALTGNRRDKLVWLDSHTIVTTSWRRIEENWSTPAAAGVTAPALAWYAAAPAFTDIFREYISGVQTKNDALFLARSRTALQQQIESRFGEFDPALVQTILVGPFDPWWIYYAPEKLGRSRYQVMRHMLRDNLAFVFMRQATTSGDYDHILAVRHMATDRIFHSRWGAPFLAPQTLWEEEQSSSNLAVERPDEWLRFAYALMHTRWYRRSAADALRRDFPRIPAPSQFSPQTSAELIALGDELISLHAPLSSWRLMQEGSEAPCSFALGKRSPRVVPDGDLLRLEDATGRTFLTCSVDVWSYRIGGVDVLKRFLMRRRGTSLLEWEVDHLQQVAEILQTTLELRRRLDALDLTLS